MFVKKVCIGILAGAVLLFSGCQQNADFSPDNKEAVSISISEVLQTSKLQYPAENKDFYYNVYDDYVAITKYLGDSENVIIPNTLEDLPVYVIGPCSFEKSLIKSVEIPENVYRIGYMAFKNCVNLQSVSFVKPKENSSGTGVVEIGEQAFIGCTSLSDITIPDTVTGLYKEVFRNCTSLTKISFPSSVTAIPSGFCNGCTNLKEVYINESVTSIPTNAFQYISPDVCFYGKAYSAAAIFASQNFFSFVVVENVTEEDPVQETEETTTKNAVSEETDDTTDNATDPTKNSTN